MAISRKVEKAVSKAIDSYGDNPFTVSIAVREALFRYAVSKSFTSWANNVAKKVIESANNADKEDWRKTAASLGKSISKELEAGDVSVTFGELQNEQVTLIKSLPLKAADKVHEWTAKGITQGQRADAIIERIQSLGELTRNRAKLIARTETARAQANLRQARAVALGSEGYIWHTMGDSVVRDDHAELDGKFFKWTDPPVVDQRTGARGHPGTIYNCRCFAESVFSYDKLHDLSNAK